MTFVFLSTKTAGLWASVAMPRRAPRREASAAMALFTNLRPKERERERDRSASQGFLTRDGNRARRATTGAESARASEGVAARGSRVFGGGSLTLILAARTCFDHQKSVSSVGCCLKKANLPADIFSLVGAFQAEISPKREREKRNGLYLTSVSTW